MAEISKIKLPDNSEYDIKDSKARMIILSYGHSTWTDFITAYQNNQVIYCRASSNANPATGSQTRLAFMAYVSNADTPTNVEFQYYRSMSKHTDAQQGDQVFVYKLTNSNNWTVTTRNAFSKLIAGDNLTSTFVESETTSSITLNADYDTTVTSGSSKLITSGAVANAISSLPEPMVFKGTLGTGGTITSLPVDGSADVGDTYKVITDGTYAGQPAKAGDTFVCDSKTSSANTWVIIPSGDDGDVWQGTQAEYDALSTHDPDTLYFITDSVSPSLQVSNLTDVSLTSITNGQTLVYQNGTWVNDEAGGKVWQGTQAQYDAITTPDPEVVYYITDSTQGNFALADLTNVSFSQLTGGEVLKYDSTNNIWTNGTGGSGGTWVGTQAQYDAIVTPDPDTTYYITDGVANGYQLWKGTQAQYDAITTPDDNTIYCITDSQDVTIDADEVVYDNTSSGLSATTVQGAIDETAEAIGSINIRLGTRLIGAWTADSSNANNTYLTDEITVDVGTYLIVMSYPDISTTTFVASLYNKTANAVYDNCYMLANSLGTRTVLTAFSGTSKLCIASAQSGACSFSNKNRGSIRAIKLSDSY